MKTGQRGTKDKTEEERKGSAPFWSLVGEGAQNIVRTKKVHKLVPYTSFSAIAVIS